MKILLFLFLFIVTANSSYIAKNIKFEGLTQISNKIALETLDLNKDHKFDDKKLNIALKKFYNFKYFEDITINFQDDILIFKFKEKPFIINLSMTGYKTSDDELKQLYGAMKIKKGSIFTQEKIDNAKQILLSILKEEGYANSVVEIEEEVVNSKGSVAITFKVNKGDEIIITKTNYIGAKSLSKSQLEENTANKEEVLISWWFGQSDGVMKFSQLKYDTYRLKDIYLQHGYLDVKVKSTYSSIDFNTNKATLDFIINEGKQYKVNDITVNLNEEITPPFNIVDIFKLKKDKIFNIAKLRNDISFIKTQIQDKGYAYVKVSYDIKKDKINNTVDVIINVKEGNKVYIHDIIISGNNRTLDRVIRRNIYLSPKSLFNLTDFRDSKSKILRSGFFKNVELIQKRIDENNIDILVKVEETTTGSFVLGGGYSTQDGAIVNASISDKNIFGSGLEIKLAGEYSKSNKKVTISLINPAIYDSLYNGSFSLYTKNTIIKDSDEDNKSSGNQVTQIDGLSFGAGRYINRNTRVGSIYSLSHKNIDDDLNNSLDDQYVVSSLKPYISFDNTDSYYTPRRGIQTGYSLEIAGIGGDAQYLENKSYLKYYFGLKDYIDYIDYDLILRIKTHLNWLIDTGNIKDKTYYLGGASSLRGYKRYAYRASNYKAYKAFTKQWYSSFEITFPIIAKARMRGALFLDYGTIGEKNLTDITDASYGISINWFSPFGPLQFIFAKPIDEKLTLGKTEFFTFNLGQTF